jgi:hypothetical protein
MSLLNELRILLAEWLLKQAQRAMPDNAPEARPLAEALDGYVLHAAQIQRWEKFPC